MKNATLIVSGDPPLTDSSSCTYRNAVKVYLFDERQPSISHVHGAVGKFIDGNPSTRNTDTGNAFHRRSTYFCSSDARINRAMTQIAS